MARFALTLALLLGLGGCGSTASSPPDAAAPADGAARTDAGPPDGGTPDAPVTADASPQSDAPPAFDGGLVGAANLVYQGAFRLPGGNHGDPNVYDTFAYGGTALAYHAAHDSLFLVGHDWDQLAGEIGIPAIVDGDNLSDLATAPVLQDVTDVTEGHMAELGAGGAAYSDTVKVGGLMVDAGRLLGSLYIYYDAASFARRSHFTSGLDLAVQGDFAGTYTVGQQNPAFVGGYMAPVPAAWRGALGGPALTGNCCLSIISRTSTGPAASVFDPADLGQADPVPASPVVGYPNGHPTLGEWGNTTVANPRYNQGTQVTGVVFPEGWRSVLFFGRTGLGVPCYGEPTDNQALDRQPVPGEPGVVYCYDPAGGGKGCHAYPYAYYVWAYDVLDLVQVKNGQKEQWEIEPYATWALDLPFASDDRAISGAAYDPQHGRIFLSQAHGDASGLPLIHVLGLTP
ncbi:MAG TPA: hypothetical protein VGQ83_08215 [Polyangia bacterium]